MSEETALVTTLSSGLEKLRRVVATFTLADMADRHKAVQVTDLALRAKAARDLARSREKEELAPLEAAADAIREKWHPFVTEFGEIEKGLKLLVAEHVRLDNERVAAIQKKAADDLAELAKSKEEAERLSREASTPAAKARAQLSLVQLVTLQGRALDALDANVRAVKGVKVEGGGTMSVSERWVWEVVDASKVPREYLSPDKAKISAAVKGGLRKLAGIRVYPISSVSSRRSHPAPRLPAGAPEPEAQGSDPTPGPDPS